MKARMCPCASFFAMLFCAIAIAAAQDSVVLKTGQRSNGQILGMNGANVRIKIGPVETAIPGAQIASITMAAPKAYNDALAAWKSGDAQKTLAPLKPLVETFRGLPTPWAQRASALLGEVYLALNQTSEAEAAFANFQKAYPSSKSLADIGLARLAVNKKDYTTARALLTPVIAESKTILLAESEKSAAYGQACYLMGIILEASGDYPEALRSYLSTVTLFYEDPAVVAQAQARADLLMKDKTILVP